MKQFICSLTVMTGLAVSWPATAGVTVRKVDDRRTKKLDRVVFELDGRQAKTLYNGLKLEVVERPILNATVYAKQHGDKPLDGMKRASHSFRLLLERTVNIRRGKIVDSGSLEVYVGQKSHASNLYYNRKAQRYELVVQNRPALDSKGKKRCWRTMPNRDPCQAASRIANAMTSAKIDKKRHDNGIVEVTKTLELKPEEKTGRSAYLTCVTAENDQGKAMASSDYRYMQSAHCRFGLPAKP